MGSRRNQKNSRKKAKIKMKPSYVAFCSKKTESAFEELINGKFNDK